MHPTRCTSFLQPVTFNSTEHKADLWNHTEPQTTNRSESRGYYFAWPQLQKKVKFVCFRRRNVGGRRGGGEDGRTLLGRVGQTPAPSCSRWRMRQGFASADSTAAESPRRLKDVGRWGAVWGGRGAASARPTPGSLAAPSSCVTLRT